MNFLKLLILLLLPLTITSCTTNNYLDTDFTMDELVDNDYYYSYSSRFSIDYVETLQFKEYIYSPTLERIENNLNQRKDSTRHYYYEFIGNKHEGKPIFERKVYRKYLSLDDKEDYYDNLEGDVKFNEYIEFQVIVEKLNDLYNYAIDNKFDYKLNDELMTITTNDNSKITEDFEFFFKKPLRYYARNCTNFTLVVFHKNYNIKYLMLIVKNDTCDAVMYYKHLDDMKLYDEAIKKFDEPYTCSLLT